MEKSNKEDDVAVDTDVTDPKKEETAKTNEGTPIGARESEDLTKMVAELMRDDQTSPVGLTDEPSKFRNIGWTTEALPPEKIQPFTGIPYYYLPTEADRPHVTETPRGYYCLDGWDLVTNARANGAATILVDVDHMETHSDEELSMRKMVVRMNTRGDQLYAEIMRNTRDVIYKLLSSKEESLKVFTHGGRRDKIALNGNRENDAVGILAFRMRKHRDTITAALNHVKYLSNDAIQFLIEQKAKKKFFEDIQSKKKNLDTKLTSQEKTGLEKTEEISKFILEAFVKSIAPKQPVVTPSATPVPVSETLPDDDVDEFNEDDSEDDQDDDPSEEDDNPSEGAATSNEEPLTVETIKDRVMTVTKQVMEDFSKDISLSEMRSCLEKELSVIMSILSRIDSLNSGRR